MDNQSTSNSQTPQVREVGRNEPCPCGSQKKYKRCHGVDAAPKLSQPKMGANPQLPPGFDPSQMDPALMKQMSQSLSRLPRGQLQKMQAVFQRAMSGQDVSKEAADLERMLPPDFQQLMMSPDMQKMMGQFQGSMGGEAAGASMPSLDNGMPQLNSPPPHDIPQSPPENLNDARKIVQKALAEGTITAEQAAAVLGDTPPEASDSETVKGWKKWFKKS